MVQGSITTPHQPVHSTLNHTGTRVCFHQLLFNHSSLRLNPSFRGILHSALLSGELRIEPQTYVHMPSLTPFPEYVLDQ